MIAHLQSISVAKRLSLVCLAATISLYTSTAHSKDISPNEVDATKVTLEIDDINHKNIISQIIVEYRHSINDKSRVQSYVSSVAQTVLECVSIYFNVEANAPCKILVDKVVSNTLDQWRRSLKDQAKKPLPQMTGADIGLNGQGVIYRVLSTNPDDLYPVRSEKRGLVPEYYFKVRMPVKTASQSEWNAIDVCQKIVDDHHSFFNGDAGQKIDIFEKTQKVFDVAKTTANNDLIKLCRQAEVFWIAFKNNLPFDKKIQIVHDPDIPGHILNRIEGELQTDFKMIPSRYDLPGVPVTGIVTYASSRPTYTNDLAKLLGIEGMGTDRIENRPPDTMEETHGFDVIVSISKDGAANYETSLRRRKFPATLSCPTPFWTAKDFEAAKKIGKERGPWRLAANSMIPINPTKYIDENAMIRKVGTHRDPDYFVVKYFDEDKHQELEGFILAETVDSSKCDTRRYCWQVLEINENENKAITQLFYEHGAKQGRRQFRLNKAPSTPKVRPASGQCG